MRPLHFLIIFLGLLAAVDTGLLLYQHQTRLRQNTALRDSKKLVAALALTDLSITTEARYTRHPAVSDPIVPFMDHPGAIEHFPSGSFWVPPATNGIFRVN